MARYFEIQFASNGQLAFKLGASHRKMVMADAQQALAARRQAGSNSPLARPARTGTRGLVDIGTSAP